MPIKYHDGMMRSYNLRVKRKLKCHPIQVLILRTRTEQNVPPPPCLCSQQYLLPLCSAHCLLQWSRTAYHSTSTPWNNPPAFHFSFFLPSFSSFPIHLLKNRTDLKAQFILYLLHEAFCDHTTNIICLSSEHLWHFMSPCIRYCGVCISSPPLHRKGLDLYLHTLLFPTATNACTLWVLTAYLRNEWMNEW